MDEDWDWDPDHIVDPDVTGDPQLDQFGYQSPRHVPRTWAHPPASQRDWLAQSRRDYAERQRKRDRRQRQREEARRRRESPPSHNGIVPFPPGMNYQPGIGPTSSQPVNEGWSRPDVPPQPAVAQQPVSQDVAQAVERGSVGRHAGWYRVDVTPDGRTVWTRVDRPGPDGPQMTVEQVPTGISGSANSPTQWQPVELHRPSDGTQVW
jgi:hypothetical protein